MLVCNVSLRPKGHIVAADLAETAAAADLPGTGNIVFATLIDDPASATETVNAFVGVIMEELANGDDVLDAIVSNIAIAESATASDTQDATVVAAPATWNPADKGTANTILSNGNLTYGAGGSPTTNDGCRSTVGKTTGKLYFELTYSGGQAHLGITTAAATFNSIFSSGSNSFMVTYGGSLFFNGSSLGISIAAPAAGNVMCFAIDLINSRGWIRNTSGNWNNSGTADPATNTGGIDISALFPSNAAFAMVASNTATNPIVTANFGATSFAQTVPSGFVAFGS